MVKSSHGVGAQEGRESTFVSYTQSRADSQTTAERGNELTTDLDANPKFRDRRSPHKQHQGRPVQARPGQTRLRHTRGDARGDDDPHRHRHRGGDVTRLRSSGVACFLKCTPLPVLEQRDFDWT